MMDCKPVATPFEPGCQLHNIPQAPTPTNSPYREAIGCRMYLATVSGPDISYSIAHLTRYCESYQNEHWAALKRTLAYLRGTITLGTRFGSQQTGIQGYTDSDHARDPGSRRSTSGFIFLLYGGPVAWTSRRQTCVTLSSTKAEFIAESETAKEAVWFRRLLMDLKPGWKAPIPLFSDEYND